MGIRSEIQTLLTNLFSVQFPEIQSISLTVEDMYNDNDYDLTINIHDINEYKFKYEMNANYLEDREYFDHGDENFPLTIERMQDLGEFLTDHIKLFDYIQRPELDSRHSESEKRTYFL